jgi:hypothetical protein
LSFAPGCGSGRNDGHREVIDDLHGKINQLQVERDFLAGQPAILSTAERRAMIAPNATCI